MNDIQNTQQPEIVKKARKKCPHGKQKAVCRECKKLGVGGTQICIHDRQRGDCAECGPNICIHKRRRDRCIECQGTLTCIHKRLRAQCKECHGTRICIHKRARDSCIDCKRLGIGGARLCIHGRTRGQCARDPCYLTATQICQICFDSTNSINSRDNSRYTIDGTRSCARCFHTYFNARLGECATTAERLAILRKPSNRRIKEIRIAGDVIAAFGDRGWDFQGYTADCDDTLNDEEAVTSTKAMGGFTRLKWYFTDMESVIEDGNTILVVEIDEHEHKRYPVTCEYNRMLGVVAAHRGKRVLFARFNPDEWSLCGQKVGSTFTKNADGIFEPNDSYEPCIDYFTQCIRELCSGSLLRLDDRDGLMGVMYVNYSTDSAAVAYSTEHLGGRNVCVKQKCG